MFKRFLGGDKFKISNISCVFFKTFPWHRQVNNFIFQNFIKQKTKLFKHCKKLINYSQFKDSTARFHNEGTEGKSVFVNPSVD